MTLADIDPYLSWLWVNVPRAVALAIPIVGFIFKEQIKQVFTLDVERLKASLAKEQAAAVAEFQRELEAYKVSLIATAERAKAQQDVRKALALKVAERRFEVISSLADAVALIDVEAAVLPTISTDRHELFEREHAALTERAMALGRVAGATQPFMSVEDRARFSELRIAVFDILMARQLPTDPPLRNDDPRLRDVVRKGMACDAIVSRLMSDYEGMADGLEGE